MGNNCALRVPDVICVDFGHVLLATRTRFLSVYWVVSGKDQIVWTNSVDAMP